jgi:dihydroflavonol-4-reductase
VLATETAIALLPEAAESRRRVLVTGGSGFIGHHLVTALGRRGALVRVLDVQRPAVPLRCEFIEGSILDRGAVMHAMDGVDTVYHLAAISHLWTSDHNDYERINHHGTRALLAAAAEMGAARFVHCSTESILFPTPYGERGFPLHVADMPGPYTRSKFLAEQAALEAANDGLHVVIVSPTVPIGPGDHNLTAPTAMLSLLARQPPRFVLDCTLNLVDVRDVAVGIVLAGDRGRPGERYILGGESIRMRDLIDRIGTLTGKRTALFPIPGVLALVAGWAAEHFATHVSHCRPVATTEGVRIALRSIPLDIRKACDELGYAPNAVDRALADALAWLIGPESRPELLDKPRTPEMRRPKISKARAVNAR